jgi:hypothetical protein
VLGSLAAWYLLTRGAEVRSVIAWSAAPGILAFFVLAVVLRGAGTVPPPIRAGEVDAAGRVFWAPVFALAALSFFRLPETLLLLRLQDQGVAVAAIPLVWAGLHVVRSGSAYPGGWLSDRLGPRAAIAAGGALFSAVALLLGARLTAGTAIAVFLVLGLVAGLTEGAERSLVAHLAPVRTGRGFGVYHALSGLAALPAGLAFGALYQVRGGPGALAASALGMGAATAMWLAVTRGIAQGDR